jgi:hypothetical protein
MSTFNEYYKALLTRGDVENRIMALIDKENEKFESSEFVKKHRELVKSLYEEEHKVFLERMAKVKEMNPTRRNHVVKSEPLAERKKKIEDSPELVDAISAVSKLSEADKRNLYFRCLREEIPESKENRIDDDTMSELHHILVQTVIDFLNEKKLSNVEAVRFSADGLRESSKYGEWTPATDSFLTLEGIVDEKFIDDDGTERAIPSRVEIGKSY